MIFWIAAIILTLVAMLSVLLPLARKPTDETAAIEFDKVVYRARLAEIEKDRELGRISAETANMAAAEEGRKLLALSDADGSTKAVSLSPSMRNMIAAIAVFGVPALGLGIYMSIGNPGMPDQTLAMRLSEPPENQSVDELVSRAERHLAENPDDARGWEVIAPVYMRIGRTQDAVRAWANVMRLAPQTPEIQATLAESIVAAADGVVTDQAKRLFLGELKINPSSAKARFYVAMGLGQEGRHETAIAAWDELIDGGVRGAPWLEAALNFRNRSAEAAGIPSRTLSAAEIDGEAGRPGPSAEEVEAASQMSSEDRAAMISDMVANLAGKLKENPRDKDGWQRLIRSYIVMGDRQQALASIEEALSHNSDDTDFVAQLTALRESLPAQNDESGGVSQ